MSKADFLRKYAEPDVHYTFESDPIAYIKHSPKVDTKFLHHLVDTEEYDYRSNHFWNSVLSHPKVDSALIDKIVEKPSDRFSNNKIIIGHKSATAEQIDKAVKHNLTVPFTNEGDYSPITTNNNASDDTKEFILDTFRRRKGSHYISHEFLRSNTTSGRILNHIYNIHSKVENITLHREIVKHKNLPNDLAKHMLDTNPDVTTRRLILDYHGSLDMCKHALKNDDHRIVEIAKDRIKNRIFTK